MQDNFGNAGAPEPKPSQAQSPEHRALTGALQARAAALAAGRTSPSLIAAGLVEAVQVFAAPASTHVRGSAGDLRSANWPAHSAKACQPLW
jgi:hypothetical protein